MATLKVPGVSIEEISTLPPSVAAVETAIPAFIGYTVLHSTNVPLAAAAGTSTQPVRLSSLKDFESLFGTAELESLAVVLDGSDAITSTGFTTDGATGASLFSLYYHLQLFFENGGGDCYVVSIGVADSQATTLDDAHFTAGLAETRKVDEPTLLVFPEAASLDNDAAGQGAVISSALEQCFDLKDRFTVTSVNADEDVTAFRTAVGTENLRYGAVYYPNLITGISRIYNDANVAITGGIDGYATLEDVRDGDGVLPPNTTLYNTITAAVAEKVGSLELSPDAAAAGIYATVDESRGVWKAPANVSLRGVVAPSTLLTDKDQEGLNVDSVAGKSINAIRTFTGRGTIVWGARTLDGNSNEWRYVNVRRFFTFAEESIQKAMNSFVFEPNTAQTWMRIKGTIDNFLTSQWRQGALAGAKPEDAFFVNVGLGVTMTSNDINNGILNIEIGMAAARPAEFIVLKFSQQQQVS